MDAQSRPINLAAQVWLYCATFLLLCLSLTSSSLWIDEGFSAFIASIRKFSSFLHILGACDSGDLQTGGYYLYLWLWVHVFGSGELALRASNLPFLALFCACFALVSHACFNGTRIWPICALSPFASVYLNEARVYFPLLACSSLCIAGYLLGAFSTKQHARKIAPYLFWSGLVFASGCNLLTILLYPGILMLVPGLKGAAFREWIKPGLCALPILLIEGGYYLWTLFQIQDVTYDRFRPVYILLWIYEFFGLQGIGPERNQLRLLKHGFLQNRELDVALVIGILLALLILAGYVQACRPARTIVGRLALAGTTSLICAFALSYLLNERLLPRHGATIYPFFLFALLALLAGPFKQKSFSPTAVALCLVAIWLTSDARIRFLPQYEKEDYRSAVTLLIHLSRRNQTKPVWVADYMTAAYYGLKLDNEFQIPYLRIDLTKVFTETGWSIRASGLFGSNLNQEQLRRVLQQSGPVDPLIYVAVSKPDLYDMSKTWMHLLDHQSSKVTSTIRNFGIYAINPAMSVQR